MLTLRPANERGHVNYGWLNSHHTFSFGDYYDPQHRGFGDLHVINEDRVAPNKGFAPHSHRDMEIISYVLTGSLAHADCLGNCSTIQRGDVQRMTAGSGITHSEYNPSSSETSHFLQIWIKPWEKNLPPGYEQRFFADDAKLGKWCLIASPDGRNESLRIHQDTEITVSLLRPQEQLDFALTPSRKVWVQIARGKVTCGDYVLSAGDGLAVEAIDRLTLTGLEMSEILIFSVLMR